MSAGVSMTEEVWRINPVAGLILPDGSINWVGINASINQFMRELERAMMYPYAM